MGFFVKIFNVDFFLQSQISFVVSHTQFFSQCFIKFLTMYQLVIISMLIAPGKNAMNVDYAIDLIQKT